MKKRASLFTSIVLVAFSFVMLSYTTTKNNENTELTDMVSIEIPDNVMAIIDNKCYGCHNNDSKNKKSKGKLNFNKFKKGYSKSKTISKLGKIAKDIHENEMPPEKFLAKYPDKTLTADESATLIDWAEGQRKTLAGN